MSRMPYMPFYVGDYLSDTAHLSHVENSAYLLLIFSYWQRGSLPADPAKLARIARLTDAEWKVVEPTLIEFFDVCEDGWKHGRIEIELKKAREKSEKARASAVRRHSERSASAERTDVPTECYPTQPSKEGLSNTPLTPQAEPEEGVQKCEFEGVGRVGLVPPVSAETKLRVARDLNIADAEPLVEKFESWKRSRQARDPDAMFAKAAKTLLRNGGDELLQRCGPLDKPPDIAPAVIAKPSPQLARLIGGKRAH